MMDAAFAVPPELLAQIDRVETCLNACENLDLSCGLASTSSSEEPLEKAQSYHDASLLVVALARVVSQCEGKANKSVASCKEKLTKKQERIDKARARYERHARVEKGRLTLGIDDANKVIANVKDRKQRADGGETPVKVEKKNATKTTNAKDSKNVEKSKSAKSLKNLKRRKVQQSTGVEKHKTMRFLDDLKNPV